VIVKTPGAVGVVAIDRRRLRAASVGAARGVPGGVLPSRVVGGRVVGGRVVGGRVVTGAVFAVFGGVVVGRLASQVGDEAVGDRGVAGVARGDRGGGDDLRVRVDRDVALVAVEPARGRVSRFPCKPRMTS